MKLGPFKRERSLGGNWSTCGRTRDLHHHLTLQKSESEKHDRYSDRQQHGGRERRSTSARLSRCFHVTHQQFLIISYPFSEQRRIQTNVPKRSPDIQSRRPVLFAMRSSGHLIKGRCPIGKRLHVSPSADTQRAGCRCPVIPHSKRPTFSFDTMPASFVASRRAGRESRLSSHWIVPSGTYSAPSIA
jgi:hypothetical protein